MPMPKGMRERPGFAPNLSLGLAEEVTGTILSYKVVMIDEGTRFERRAPLIQIQLESGQRKTVWLGSNISDRVSKEDVGKKIWIERIPDTPIEGQPSPMKTYNVAVEE